MKMMNVLKVENCPSHMHVLTKMILICIDLCGIEKKKLFLSVRSLKCYQIKAG